MKRGAVVNLLIGISIALLPLYIRVCEADFQRTAKDNLLIVIFAGLCVLLPKPERKVGGWAWVALVYGLFSIVMNQWNVLSINVMFQSFYILSGLVFALAFYEKHDQESIDYILKGMMVGALIQSFFVFFGYFGIDIYPMLLISFFTDGVYKAAGSGSTNSIGTLGNNNLLASYLALTSIPFLGFNKWKWLIAIPIVALLLSGSLMGLLSLSAGLLYLLNLKINLLKKWQIYAAAISAMVIYPFSGIGFDSSRILIWGKILELFDLRHVLIGSGPGWFPDRKLIVQETYIVQEHNEFLSFFNIFGLLGLIVVAPIFYRFIKKSDENKILSSVLFVAFCNAYGHFVGHQSTTVIIIIVTACICMAERNSDGINLDR